MKLKFKPSKKKLSSELRDKEYKEWATGLFKRGFNLPKQVIINQLGVSSVWIEKHLYPHVDYFQVGEEFARETLKMGGFRGGILLDRAAVAKWFHTHTRYIRQTRRLNLSRFGFTEAEVDNATRNGEIKEMFERHGYKTLYEVRDGKHRNEKPAMEVYLPHYVLKKMEDDDYEKMFERPIYLPKQFTSTEQAYRFAFCKGAVRGIISADDVKNAKKTIFICGDGLPGDDRTTADSVVWIVGMQDRMVKNGY